MSASSKARRPAVRCDERHLDDSLPSGRRRANPGCDVAGSNRRTPTHRATAPVGEGWITKQQLADHLQVTPRWIEMQQHLGLPYLPVGSLNRYIASEVEAWLRERYAPTTPEGKPDGR
jgi:hypothetical protein